MAIKERKQITGTEARIKGYAGHNGVLAYATDTKHLHVLSGTAGTTTKLASVSDIPAPVDISGKADKTYVDTELAKKQPKGDYATTSALTSGLAGKEDRGVCLPLAGGTIAGNLTVNGTLRAVTPALGTNTTQVATTEFVSRGFATDSEVVKTVVQTLSEAQKQQARTNIGVGEIGTIVSYEAGL